MLLKHWMLGVALVASAPWALADVSVDPLYGDDPQARAVLDCQADYARRYAGAVTGQRATATEVAIAAHAGCIDAFEAFIRSRVTAAGEGERMQAAMNPENPGQRGLSEVASAVLEAEQRGQVGLRV